MRVHAVFVVVAAFAPFAVAVPLATNGEYSEKQCVVAADNCMTQNEKTKMPLTLQQ